MLATFAEVSKDQEAEDPPWTIEEIDKAVLEDKYIKSVFPVVGVEVRVIVQDVPVG